MREGKKEGMAKLISADDDEAARPRLASSCVRVRTRNATPKKDKRGHSGRGKLSRPPSRYLSIKEVDSQKSLLNKVE